MRWAADLALALAGCNGERPQVLDVGAADEVVTLPGGGALLLRRALEQSSSSPCYVRARVSGTFVPMDCEQARLINVR